MVDGQGGLAPASAAGWGLVSDDNLNGRFESANTTIRSTDVTLPMQDFAVLRSDVLAVDLPGRSTAPSRFAVNVIAIRPASWSVNFTGLGFGGRRQLPDWPLGCFSQWNSAFRNPDPEGRPWHVVHPSARFTASGQWRLARNREHAARLPRSRREEPVFDVGFNPWQMAPRRTSRSATRK